tara:strand:- start:239 stop:817 length:579 start_codon:yes stop_codon:yes gene_type:complete
MKITKTQLKQIIKEELEGAMNDEPEYLQKARQRNPVPRQGRKGSYPAEVFKGNVDYLEDFGRRLKNFANPRDANIDNDPNVRNYLKQYYVQTLAELDGLVNHFNKEGQIIGGAGAQNYDVRDLQIFNNDMTNQIERFQEKFKKPSSQASLLGTNGLAERKRLYSNYYSSVLLPIQKFYESMPEDHGIKENKK